MQKAWCNFLRRERESVKRAVLFALLCLNLNLYFPALSFGASEGEATPAPTLSAETVQLLSTLPEVPVHILQKSESGSQFQLGDRIPVSVEILPEWIATSSTLHLKVPEGASELEDQGWYLDPAVQLLVPNLRFVVSPLQSGNLTLPTLLIVKEDETPVARTKPLTVQVQEMGENKNQNPEYLAPITVPLPVKYWLLLLAISAGIVALTIRLIRRYREKQALKKLVSTVPPISNPAHVIALQSISRLYSQYPYREENMKPIAFGLSEALKHFFSARFHIEASESTTDEMLALLKSVGLSSQALQDIRDFFTKLDLLKFTKSPPDALLQPNAYAQFRSTAESIVKQWQLGGDSP